MCVVFWGTAGRAGGCIFSNRRFVLVHTRTYYVSNVHCDDNDGLTSSMDTGYATMNEQGAPVGQRRLGHLCCPKHIAHCTCSFVQC